jgi:hypothetical protein
LCTATRTTLSDRCHYRLGKTERKVTNNSVQAMLIIGEGLILVYVCYTQPTASPTALTLSSNYGLTNLAHCYFALLSGKDTEAAKTALCPYDLCFVV